MNARRAARELALLSLFQLNASEGTNGLDKPSLRDLIESSVRTLVDQAREQIETAAQDMASVSQYVLDQEQEHPINLETPMGAEVQPVTLPTTREMMEKIEQCLLGAEYLHEALRIPELAMLSQSEEVQHYAIRLIRLVHQHEPEIDALLNEYSEEWRVERLTKMDRTLLRLAAVEMKYIPDVDVSVSINEAIELAKQFSTAESYRFINGVLGKLAEVIASGTPSSEAELPHHV